MYENTYPAFYYFVIEKQITPAEYQVVEYDNEDGEFSLTEAREEVDQSSSDWSVLCAACDVDDAHELIDSFINIDEIILGNQN
jgi:hypothetical protein